MALMKWFYIHLDLSMDSMIHCHEYQVNIQETRLMLIPKQKGWSDLFHDAPIIWDENKLFSSQPIMIGFFFCMVHCTFFILVAWNQRILYSLMKSLLQLLFLYNGFKCSVCMQITVSHYKRKELCLKDILTFKLIKTLFHWGAIAYDKNNSQSQLVSN